MFLGKEQDHLPTPSWQRQEPSSGHPLHMYLPSPDEYDNLRIRMEVIVMRITKEHIPAFSLCDVPMHVEHQYSYESSQRSGIVSNHVSCFLAYMRHVLGRNLVFIRWNQNGWLKILVFLVLDATVSIGPSLRSVTEWSVSVAGTERWFN